METVLWQLNMQNLAVERNGASDCPETAAFLWMTSVPSLSHIKDLPSGTVAGHCFLNLSGLRRRPFGPGQIMWEPAAGSFVCERADQWNLSILVRLPQGYWNQVTNFSWTTALNTHTLNGIPLFYLLKWHYFFIYINHVGPWQLRRRVWKFGSSRKLFRPHHWCIFVIYSFTYFFLNCGAIS